MGGSEAFNFFFRALVFWILTSQLVCVCVCVCVGRGVQVLIYMCNAVSLTLDRE